MRNSLPPGRPLVVSSLPACKLTPTYRLLEKLISFHRNLYRIQGNIIGNIYNHNVISSHTLRSDELCSKIVTLDYELNQWKRNLPLNMALVPLELLEAMEIENWAYTRTQTVLTLRYLNSRTLLFRKMLEQMLKQGTEQDSTLNYTDCMPLLGDAMVQTCTMMATYTITLIHKVRTRPDLLPAWWFTTYYGRAPIPRI